MPKRVQDVTLKEYCDKRKLELMNDIVKYNDLSNQCEDESCKIQYDIQYDIAKATLKELNNIIALCEKRKRY